VSVLTLEFLPAAAPATDVEVIEEFAAGLLREANEERQLLDEIVAAHVERADGARVQAVLAPMLLRRGFEFEKTGLSEM
jgi:hypothetical protein